MISLSAPKYHSYSQAHALMGQMIRESTNDPYVRELATSLIKNIPSDDHFGELEVLFEYVRDRIRYTADPTDEDLYQTASLTFETGVGDCDDKVIALGSLLRSVGFPVKMVFVFDAPPKYETEFPAHVYLMADQNKGSGQAKWIPLETIPVPGGRGGNILMGMGEIYPYGFPEEVEVLSRGL